MQAAKFPCSKQLTRVYFCLIVWTEKGDLYMWGNARDCQLGVPGLPEIQPLPVKVNFLTDGDEDLGPHRVISVAIGASHAMCLVSRQQNEK
jgi:alpha-tubulin suppressor-like RCC1 family protein